MTEPGETARSGRLAVVGTPIGNLGDLSERGREVLASATLIACEDTRRTGSLLSLLGLANPGMVVANEHTERRVVERVLAELAGGGRVALTSDAGMPAISDPGAALVAAVAEAGHEVVVVPGPTAVSSALALAGFTCPRFVFEGFLPRKGRERTRRLAALADEPRVIVLYEAPHRIERTLTDLAASLDATRACVVARELTKMHETVWRGALGDAAPGVGDPRGEYVIVVDEAAPAGDVDDAALAAAVLEATRSGSTTRDAVSMVAERFGVGRRRVYELANRAD